MARVVLHMLLVVEVENKFHKKEFRKEVVETNSIYRTRGFSGLIVTESAQRRPVKQGRRLKK